MAGTAHSIQPLAQVTVRRRPSTMLERASIGRRHSRRHTNKTPKNTRKSWFSRSSLTLHPSIVWWSSIHRRNRQEILRRIECRHVEIEGVLQEKSMNDYCTIPTYKFLHKNRNIWTAITFSLSWISLRLIYRRTRREILRDMDIRDIEIGDIFMEILEFDDLRGIVREIFLVRYFCVLCFSTPILVAANMRTS